jgi:hypothetical protein
VNDLEQPVSGKELEFDVAVEDFALQLDHHSENDGKKHEEDCQESGGQDTFDDGESGAGYLA